eukprot:1390377-Amorphochlora_amoeboformis.AAC.2
MHGVDKGTQGHREHRYTGTQGHRHRQRYTQKSRDAQEQKDTHKEQKDTQRAERHTRSGGNTQRTRKHTKSREIERYRER